MFRSGADSPGSWAAEYNPFGSIDLKFTAEADRDASAQNIANLNTEPVNTPATVPVLPVKPKYSDVVVKKSGNTQESDGSADALPNARIRMPPRLQKSKKSMSHRTGKDFSNIIKPESRYG